MSLDGQLRDFDVLFVLRSMIEHSRATRLLVIDDQHEGEVTVAEGKIIDARSGETTGLDALFDVLTWRAGSFHLIQGDNDSPVTIGLSWNAVLREAFSRASTTTSSLPEDELPTERIAIGAKTQTESQLATEGEPALARFEEKTGSETDAQTEVARQVAQMTSPEGHKSDAKREAEAPRPAPVTEPVDQVEPISSSPPTTSENETVDPDELDVPANSSAPDGVVEDEGSESETERFEIDASFTAESRLLDLLPRLEHEAVRLSNAGPSEGPHVALRTMARLIRFVKTNSNLQGSIDEITQPINQLLGQFGLPTDEAPSGEELISAYHGCGLEPHERRRSLLTAARSSLEITALHFQNLTSSFDSADEKLRFRGAYQTVLADLEHRLHEAPL